MGLLQDVLDLLRERLRARLGSVRIPAELPRSPREALALLCSAAQALVADPPPPPVTAADRDVRPQPPSPGEVASSPSSADERTAEPPGASAETTASREEAPPNPDAPDGAADPLDGPLPPLPEEYGEDRIALVPRDPNWLYAYWELTESARAKAHAQGATRLGLRLFDLGEDGDEPPFTDHAFGALARNYHLPARPNRRYRVELGGWTAEGSWLPLLHSDETLTPPQGASPNVRDVFLTLPFDRQGSNGASQGHPLRRANAEIKKTLAEMARGESSSAPRSASQPPPHPWAEGEDPDELAGDAPAGSKPPTS